ncbi:hypothetical protein D9757_006349 [Collybiopsis confluens]|uniref:Uncharacterized protein n=1 Tax=Collybiopsis confluens TaxID=2823264 RepID=A0A8H5HGQ6_9AGAR|nr:hypothetical protein D9757_006349 [Collybiopsis confluens]
MLLAFLLVPLSLASNVVPQLALSQQSLIFASGWKSTSAAASGNFLFTDTLGQALTVTLPLSTSSLNYSGLRRTGGSIYGVCIDCPTGATTNLQLFSGHDSTLLSNADAQPTTIFSLDVDPSQEHILQILNLADSRFGNTSEITFISIAIHEGSSVVTSSSASSTSSTAVSISTASISSASVTSSSSLVSASAVPSPSSSSAPVLEPGRNQTRNSLIAITTIISLIVVLSLAVGIFFYRRNHYQSSVFDDLTKIEDPPAAQKMLFPSTPGFLTLAGRQKPPTRLPERYTNRSDVSQNNPIIPVRRLDTG